MLKVDVPAEIISILDITKQQYSSIGIEEHEEEHAHDDEETLPY